MKQPVVLVILDGWGYSTESTGNPFHTANLSTYNFLKSAYPNILLQASGPAVGLSWGEAGNSEVGHVNIGAGRIVMQYSERIDNAIKNKTLETNPILDELKNHINQNQSRIHLIGLLTSGRVHASFDHLKTLIEILVSKGFQNIFLHLFTDGKDSGLKEAPDLLEKLGKFIREKDAVKVSTIIGRNFGMDRNYNWELTKATFELTTLGKGDKTDDFIRNLQNHYEHGLHDSNIPAMSNKNYNDGSIKDNDAVLFFNFREDSMRQIIQSFTVKDFQFFERILPKNLLIATMTQYIEDKNIRVLFVPPDIKNGFSDTLSKAGKNQLHIAESEKYAHVTYFFNGLQNRSDEREVDVFIDSLENVEKNPEMKSKEITDRIIQDLNLDFYDFIVANFANGDVLAHTGNFDAAVAGLESVDKALSRLQPIIMEKNGILIITADHGNVENLTYKGTGEKESRHNINPVPLILIGKDFKNQKGEPNKISGILADIAPTILDLMGIEKPEEMTGQSLLGVLI